jgi:multisubunit Na+/H+ antiporter MnhG subunit
MVDPWREVVGVVGLEHRRPDVDSRAARRAWIAVALVPAGLLLGIGLAWAGLAYGGNAVAIFGAALVWVAAPVAAVVLGLPAARAGHRSARTAVITAGLAFVTMLLLSAALLGPLPALGGLVAALLVGTPSLVKTRKTDGTSGT